MRENRLQVVSEGKEAARQTLKHGKQEVKRGDKKEDMGQEGGRAVLMPPGTVDGHRLGFTFAGSSLMDSSSSYQVSDRRSGEKDPTLPFPLNLR